jgi:hypothetical protein
MLELPATCTPSLMGEGCPGCNNPIHIQCQQILDFKEWFKVNGKMRWFAPDSIVYFAGDP